jgi:hypothetical protein
MSYADERTLDWLMGVDDGEEPPLPPRLDSTHPNAEQCDVCLGWFHLSGMYHGDALRCTACRWGL